MVNQLTSNAEALRLFFTEDVFLVKNEQQIALAEPVMTEMPATIAEKQVSNEMQTPVAPAVLPLPEPKKDWNFEFLGKNQKRILILVNDQANKVSSVQGTELLRKLVKAIELTNNDFALVNCANYATATFEDFHSFFSCELVLSFGVTSAQLGLSLQPLHQLFKHGEIKMIFTSNLHELDGDQASKKTLWTTLQQLK